MNRCRVFFILSFWVLSASSAKAQLTGDVLSIGDSLTAGLNVTSGGLITCLPLGGAVLDPIDQPACIGGGQRNIGGWQPELSRALAVGVFNYGNSGELTSQMLNRLNAHMSRTPSQFVLIMGGTNDVIVGVSQSTILSNLEVMINFVRAAGREPIVGTLPPFLNSRFAALNPTIVSVNNQIMSIDGVRTADHYSVLVGNWGQNTSGDFVHLGPQGNSVVSQEWGRVISVALESEFNVSRLVPAIILLLLNDS